MHMDDLSPAQNKQLTRHDIHRAIGAIGASMTVVASCAFAVTKVTESIMIAACVIDLCFLLQKSRLQLFPNVVS